VVLILNKDAMKKPFPSITAIFNEKAIRPCFREKDFLDENHAWKD